MKRLLLLILFFTFNFAGYTTPPDEPPVNEKQVQLAQHNPFDLKIYPNPSETGRINLEMNQGEIQEIRLIDIAGKEVVARKLDFGSPKYLLLLEEVPNGIYFVRVRTTENKIVVKKLVVSTR